MNSKGLLNLRLYNQHLSNPDFTTTAQVVSWFGAVQAQDYPNAKWAVGQRMKHATDKTIEDAFTKGEILRTHLMRPTWHFVAPEDIRWLLALTAPQVKRVMSSYNRKLGLNVEIFQKANKVFVKALSGKKALTRQELNESLKKSGINTKDQMLAHIAMNAELDAVICSGPRRDGKFTYMLLEERVAKTKALSREESLYLLTQRYFTSHGPATIRDFVWWSGLKTDDARKGIEMNKPLLSNETIDNVLYWYIQNSHLASPKLESPISHQAFLLPNYDEFGIAYTERSAFYNPIYAKLLTSRGNALFQHMIVIDGNIVGLWKRIAKKDSIEIQTHFFMKPSIPKRKAFLTAVKKLEVFLDTPLNVQSSTFL